MFALEYQKVPFLGFFMHVSDLYMMIYNEWFIYVNVNGHLESDCKLYVDSTSSFFIFCEIHTSVNDLNDHLELIFNQALKGRRIFTQIRMSKLKKQYSVERK